MIANVVLTGNGVGLPLIGQVLEDGDVEVLLPRTNPPRSVVVGRRDRRDEPDDSPPYIAFIYFTHSGDHKAFVSARTDGMNASQRLLWMIFAKEPDNPEPEAPTQVVVLDGASVIAVDVSIALPGYKLYLDERLIP